MPALHGKYRPGHPRNTAETIYLLSQDPHFRQPGADRFPERAGDFHKLTFRSGLSVSVPHFSSPAKFSEIEARGFCQSAIGGDWATNPAAQGAIASTAFTPDGAIRVISCPWLPDATWTFLAGRGEDGSWGAIARLDYGHLLTYEPASHTALMASGRPVSTLGMNGREGFLDTGAARELFEILPQADEAVREKLEGARLSPHGTTWTVADGPGWAHIVASAQVADPGKSTTFQRNSTVDFHFLADAFAANIDRVQLDRKGGANSAFYPRLVDIIATLRGAWQAVDAPKVESDVPMPLYDGAPEAKKPIPPPDVMLSLGTAAPPVSFPMPGAGPGMTVDVATSVYQTWVNQQSWVSPDVKASHMLPFGVPVVAKSWVPLTSDGGLVMVNAEHLHWSNPTYFVAARVAGAWRVVAVNPTGNALLAWNRVSRSGIAADNRKEAVEQAALLALEGTAEHPTIDWGTNIQTGLDGESAVVNWSAASANKRIKGILHARRTQLSTGFWKVQLVD